ncbi:DUF2254 domain-containing protein [Mycolicibacterium aichiense]|uniref:DUF2254 domain-containing protein n=1 Tax=Mycolicibacterium aichiense TaxID=1799 RepID=UPI003D67AB1E
MFKLLAAARQRRAVLDDAIRSRLWPVPALGVVAAVAVGVGLPKLDAVVDNHMSPTLAGYLFGGSADAAREVLGAIATSLMTVTSLTFSLTLVTLQLASSQYSPRLLRTFAADPFVQRTLALFLATFAYALTVLRTVRNDNQGSGLFVPRISVTVAYLLAMASVLVLVLFLGHLVRQIRIETMLDHVSADISDTTRRTLDPIDEQQNDVSPTPPPHCDIITADSSGFLVQVDDRALVSAAVDAGAVVWIDRPVGSNVVAGVPVAFFWGIEPGKELDDDGADALRRCVAAALHTGVERTATQDIGYGLRQMTDVAVRALSPGINDPTTAIHALNSCTAVLCELARYRLGTRILRDDDDVIRVVIAQPDLPDLLDLVCGQPRLYGAQDPQVMGTLLALLRDVAWVVRLPEHREAIAQRCARLQFSIAAQNFDAAERSQLDRIGREVGESLNRLWSPST